VTGANNKTVNLTTIHACKIHGLKVGIVLARETIPVTSSFGGPCICEQLHITDQNLATVLRITAKWVTTCLL